MSPYKVTTHIPPEYATLERIERLKQAGFETDGHIDQLREIITQNGYPLPSQEGEHFGFVFRTPFKDGEKQQVYTRLYLTRVDSFAELILMLKKFKMI